MIDLENYPLLQKFATEMSGNHKYDSLGTESKQKEIFSIMRQRRMKSMILKGFPGVGKTQIIETLAKKTLDKGYIFLSIDLEKMGGQGNNMFGENIKGLIEETIELDKNSEYNIVLFIDEFHKVAMPGYEAGIDGFKTVLARGEIILIGATTYKEFGDYIEENGALYERLESIDIDEPPNEVVKKIVRDMWVKEIGDIEPVNDKLIKGIVESGKYLPAQANPRKSLKLLDRMIGIYDSQNVAMDETLLDRVVYNSTGINTKHRPNIDEIEKELKRNLKGQPDAIKVLVDSLHIAMAGLNPEEGPMGSFIFMGPTGVGKTLSAKIMARMLFENEKAMLRYDMSEYQGENATVRFQQKIADDIGRKPYSIVLCDEAEKASKEVLDLLLQITSDGRLENKYSRQVTFNNAYIILTTNIGSSVFEEGRRLNEDLSGDAYDTKAAGEVLQSENGINGFRPELVNRMTGIIPFNPLKPQTKKEIVELELEKIKKTLKEEQKLLLETSDRTITFLYKEGISSATTAGGGRDVVNRIRNHVLVNVSKVINKYIEKPDRHLLRIKLEPLGELVSETQKERISTAKLRPVEYDVLHNKERIEKYKGREHRNVNKAYDALDERVEISYELLDLKTNKDKSLI